MQQDELLDCMREATDALKELAEVSPMGADEHVDEAVRQVALAIAIVKDQRKAGLRLVLD